MPMIAFCRRAPQGEFALHLSDGDRTEAVSGPATLCATPAFSPDGATVLYSRGNGSGAGLEALDLASGGNRALSLGAHHDFAPAWSGDGRRVAFCRAPRLELSQANAIELYGAEWPAFQPRRLTRNLRFDAYPCFADPDLVVYESGDKDGFFGIFTFPWTGEAETPLAYDPDRRGIGIPHAHGRFVAVEQCDAATPDRYHLRVYSLDTGQESFAADLPDNAGGNPSPRFSPDGRSLACYAWSGGRGRIVLADLATGALRDIAPAGMSLKLPRWSADGTVLCCEETLSESLALVDVGTGDARIVPDSGGFRMQRFGELYNFDIR